MNKEEIAHILKETLLFQRLEPGQAPVNGRSRTSLELSGR